MTPAEPCKFRTLISSFRPHRDSVKTIFQRGLSMSEDARETPLPEPLALANSLRKRVISASISLAGRFAGVAGIAPSADVVSSVRCQRVQLPSVATATPRPVGERLRVDRPTAPA